MAAASDASIDVIAPVDLLVTPEELREANLPMDAATQQEALRRSEGLAIAVRREIDEALQRVSGSRERLRRMLRAEIGERGSRHEAAMRAALLPRVDGAILAEWGVPARFAEEMDAAGLADWDGDWLRFHPFIRSVIVEDTERLLPLAERNRLIAAAVRASLIRRDPLPALRAAFDIDDLALATEVVFANMVELLETRDATYEVFTHVSFSRLRGYPGLTVMLVLLSNMAPDTRPRAVQLLASESLFQRLNPNNGLLRERVAYRAFEAAALRLTPFSGRALPLIRRSAEDIAALSDEDMSALGRIGPMLHVHLGIGALYLRDIELARRCFEIADAQHAEAGRPDRVDPLSLRGGLAALTGDLAEARRLLAEADAAVWPKGWRDSSPADFLNLGMAILALEEGDPHAAQAHLDAAGPIVDIVEHWTFYAFVRARRDRLAGEIEAGLMRILSLRERRGSSPGTPMSRSLLDAAEAELRLAAGEAASARRIAARSAKHSSTCRIVLARAELALDRPAAAVTQVQRVLGAAGVTSRSRLEAELVLAACALRIGHRADAETVATRIAELLRTTGLRGPLRAVSSRDRGGLGDVLLQVGVDPAIVALVGTDASSPEADALRATLTPREQVVLEMLSEGGSLDEIAARLFVSRNTVKTQLRSIYRKLGVSSREAVLTRAAVLGLLQRSST